MATLSSIDSPLPEFHLFPKLPIELRLKIWGFAAPPPRIITQLKNKYLKRTTCVRVPAILRVCRESRNEYIADTNTPIWKHGHPTYTLVHIKYPVYFSYEIDTLYVVSEGIFDQRMLLRLRFLAVDEYDLLSKIFRDIRDFISPVHSAQIEDEEDEYNLVEANPLEPINPGIITCVVKSAEFELLCDFGVFDPEVPEDFITSSNDVGYLGGLYRWWKRSERTYNLARLEIRTRGEFRSARRFYEEDERGYT